MEKEIIADIIKKSKEKIFAHWRGVILVLVLLIFANLLFVKYSVIHEQGAVTEASLFKTYKTVGNCFYQKEDSNKWLFLSGEEILSAGNEIQTDSDSHAILSFIGQSGRIELSQKTHIRVVGQGQNTVLDFKKGEVYINYQAGNVHKPLFVKLGPKTFKITNADLYIVGDIEDQIHISVEYGKAIMQEGSQASTFEKGQSVYFKSEKEYSVEDEKIKIATPFNYDRYNLVENEYSVRFAFSEIPEELPVQLMLGNQLDNMKPYFDSPQKFSKNEFSIPFKKGSYYWQIVAFKEKAPFLQSSVKRFFVEPQMPIQLVRPLLNTKFQLVNRAASVQFQWDNPSQLEKVFVEISDQKDFKKILVHESIPENNYFNYEFDSVGDYYWRVSGFPFGTSELVLSSIGKISIVDEVVPQQVKILFPREKVVLTTLSLKSSDITFQWTKNPATRMYTVEIKSLKDGKVETYETQNASLKIKDLEQGAYQWRVYDKQFNIASQEEQFQVVQTRRLNFSRESDETGYLSWQQGPRGTAEYRVEALRIGSRSDFNAFFDPKSETKRSLEIKGDRISYKNFSEGIYAFKVYALDSDKKILADSNLKFLKVRKKD